MELRRQALLAHSLNIFIVGGMFIFSLSTFDDIPGKIPMHFNVSGYPDSWYESTLLNYLIIPLGALGMTILLYASALLIPIFRKRPGKMNLPRKMREKFLSLSPENQMPVFRLQMVYIYWVCVLINLLYLYIQAGMYRVAVGQLVWVEFWIPLMAFMGVIVFSIIVLIRKMGSMIDRLHTQEHGQKS